jgi:hypothetical protein
MWSLAEALRAAVRAQGFERIAEAFPSIDLAVVRFAPGREALSANVLFSREHPEGLVAEMSRPWGSVANIRFDADLRDEPGLSLAWQPGADWSRLPFGPLHGDGPARFVAPYPASLLKLMVAVGIGTAVDEGLCTWPAALEPMLVLSDNDATNDCVALLHGLQRIDTLNTRFAALGLHTLQLNGTTPAGGWRNADGAGVGHIHMTAWDTVRLLWLLDREAPPPPWLPRGTELLQPATRRHLRGLLERQRWDHVLSSGSLRGTPGWVPGLPDAPAFAHKTGTTDNYASDAGIVRTPSSHYLVAMFSNLGRRFAPHPNCAVPWQLPTLGAAVHRLMETGP